MTVASLIAFPNRWNFVAPYFLHELLLPVSFRLQPASSPPSLLVLVFSSAAHPARDLNHSSVNDFATLQLFTSLQHSPTQCHVHVLLALDLLYHVIDFVVG